MTTTCMWMMVRALLRGDTERKLLEVIDYLAAEAQVLKARYEADCGKRLLLNDKQRRELAEKSKPVIGHGFSHIIQIAKPDTLLRWYRRLVARKFDGSAKRHTPGRPEIRHMSASSSFVSRERTDPGDTIESPARLPTSATSSAIPPSPTS